MARIAGPSSSGSQAGGRVDRRNAVRRVVDLAAELPGRILEGGLDLSARDGFFVLDCRCRRNPTSRQSFLISRHPTGVEVKEHRARETVRGTGKNEQATDGTDIKIINKLYYLCFICD